MQGEWTPWPWNSDVLRGAQPRLTFRPFSHPTPPHPPPQFIEGRLEKLNTGEGFSDLFEQAITCSGASSGEPCV